MAITQTDTVIIAKMAVALDLTFSTLKPITGDFESSKNRDAFLELLRRYAEAYEVVDEATGNAESARQVLERIKKSSESQG